MRESAKREVVRQGQIADAVQLSIDPELLRGTLMDLVVTSGLEAVKAMLEKEREELCGPRYRHDASRTASRGGYARGELPLTGRKVTLLRPRVMEGKGKQRRERPLRTWAELSKKDMLDKRAVDQVLFCLSRNRTVLTPCYAHGEE